MIGSLFKYLYGSTPVEFASDFDIDESVERLSNASERSFMGSLMRGQAAEGDVSKEAVSLKRRVLLIPNFYAPCFTGSFARKAGKVVLAGQYTAGRFARFFFSFYFLLSLLGAALTLPKLSLQDSDTWLMPGFSLLMLICAVGLLALYKAFVSKDMVWLSHHIRETLRADSTYQQQELFPEA